MKQWIALLILAFFISSTGHAFAKDRLLFHKDKPSKCTWGNMKWGQCRSSGTKDKLQVKL